jgi:site-specific DNA-methyltransferase (adenine-specific)
MILGEPLVNEQVALRLSNRNPDVLDCIANLSSDEVFTPPDMASRMLDTLEGAWSKSHNGESLWENPDVRFLDPFTKSGVFLREITSRLVNGLEFKIPDLQDRVDHILASQVFGIGITSLTALLARRSLYCSKRANGTHSITRSFDSEDGNIWFDRLEHSWIGATDFVESADSSGRPIRIGINGRCKYCGASQKNLDRAEELETHAYAFIHTDNIRERIEEIFGADMQFDVIIGNPPYQLNDGGFSASSSPIYQKFVEQAMALEPRLICMVIPSRWFGGGKGLDTFRQRMLKDRHIRSITDFVVERDAFPGVNINGGVNYFLWDRDNEGDCTVQTVAPGGIWEEPVKRPLDEFDIFVRRNKAISILRKVQALGEATFDLKVSSRKPFGLPTDFHGVEKQTSSRNIKLYGSGRVSWVNRDQISNGEELVDQWKVLVSRASDGNENYPLPIWDQAGPFVAGPGEACSETYLVASSAKTEREAQRIVSYMDTLFFRFLVSLRKITQDNKADIFSFVPDLPMNKKWTDSELYARYGLDGKEVDFIASIIREVDFTNA